MRSVYIVGLFIASFKSESTEKAIVCARAAHDELQQLTIARADAADDEIGPASEDSTLKRAAGPGCTGKRKA